MRGWNTEGDLSERLVTTHAVAVTRQAAKLTLEAALDAAREEGAERDEGTSQDARHEQVGGRELRLLGADLCVGGWRVVRGSVAAAVAAELSSSGESIDRRARPTVHGGAP